MGERLLLQDAILDAQASFREAFRIVMERTRDALRGPESNADASIPTSAPTGEGGEVGEAQEARE
jgi:hypothetical protein